MVVGCDGSVGAGNFGGHYNPTFGRSRGSTMVAGDLGCGKGGMADKNYWGATDYGDFHFRGLS